MPFKNKGLVSNLILITLQQIFLAASTYFIALAGSAIVQQKVLDAVHYISLFFFLALAAYLTSSIVSYNENNLKNQLWRSYITHLFRRLSMHESHSGKNKDQTVQWINGEAHSTIHETVEFVLDTYSTYLNVVFTFFIFFITIGTPISSLILISLLISTGMVTGLRKRIHSLAEGIQGRKLDVFMQIPQHWDKHFFSNQPLKNEIESRHENKMNSYFDETKKYQLLEQLIACTPIVVTVPMIIIYLRFGYQMDITSIGALVAVLPRSLQLLSNVHSLSICNSKALFIWSKNRNLNKFADHLDKHDFRNAINTGRIRIKSMQDTNVYQTDDFLSLIRTKALAHGRFLIEGENGSGKSSLLMTIKSEIADCIYVTVDSNLFDCRQKGSSGQAQLSRINLALKAPSSVILLDEWNSNLDQENTRFLDTLIEAASKERLIVEVRHR